MGSRKWEDLPADCLVGVFVRVGLQHLLFDMPLVCKSWHQASLLPLCWEKLNFRSVFRDSRVLCYKDIKLIQFALRRSSGTTKAVVLSDYCTMEGLQYVAKQCPLLIALWLPNIRMTDEEKQQNFPDHLKNPAFPRHIVLKDVISQIGTNCIELKVLHARGIIDIEVATAFVHFLPNMRCLWLRGSYIARESLVLILHGCKSLEVLDVSYCMGFNEDDAEILELASYVKNFSARLSMVEYCAFNVDTELEDWF